LKPIRFAGTWKEYSNNAIPQLIKIIATRLKFLNQFIWPNFRCPYQAKVIKVLDTMRSKTVRIPLFIKY
jgi:hypothetical protein